MTQRIAKEDIVQENEHGQRVVVVAKGQPIPDDVKVDSKQVEGPAENKARRSRSTK